MLARGFLGFLGTFTNMTITSSVHIHYQADKYPIKYTYIPKVSDIYRRHSAAKDGKLPVIQYLPRVITGNYQ